MEELVIFALQQESDRIVALIEELSDRGVAIPEHLLDQGVVVANIIVMIKTDGLIAAMVALAATYPLADFEKHFTIYETDEVTRK